MMIKMVYGLEGMRLVAGEASFVCLFVFFWLLPFSTEGENYVINQKWQV